MRCFVCGKEERTLNSRFCEECFALLDDGHRRTFFDSVYAVWHTTSKATFDQAEREHEAVVEELGRTIRERQVVA